VETLVTDNKNATFLPDVLLGLGKNDSGQLAQPRCHALKPCPLSMPPLLRGETIAQVQVQWGRSAVLTSTGRVFVTAFQEDAKETGSDKD
jgi:hypothetical protein